MAEKTSLGALPGFASSTLRFSDVGWRRAAQVPHGGFRVTLAGRAFARSQPREVEQRVPVEKLDEMLAHHSGSAEDADFDSAHCCCNCLTIL